MGRIMRPGGVYETRGDSPRVPAALCELPNVVLLPHIGSATHETRGAMEDLLLDNLDSFLREGRLLTPV